MFYCNDCELIVREDDADVEEIMTMGSLQKFNVCPVCGKSLDYHFGEKGKMYENAFAGFGNIFNPGRERD